MQFQESRHFQPLPSPISKPRVTQWEQDETQLMMSIMVEPTILTHFYSTLHQHYCFLDSEHLINMVFYMVSDLFMTGGNAIDVVYDDVEHEVNVGLKHHERLTNMVYGTPYEDVVCVVWDLVSSTADKICENLRFSQRETPITYWLQHCVFVPISIFPSTGLIVIAVLDAGHETFSGMPS